MWNRNPGGKWYDAGLVHHSSILRLKASVKAHGNECRFVPEK
jgi:hypothetical protein